MEKGGSISGTQEELGAQMIPSRALTAARDS